MRWMRRHTRSDEIRNEVIGEKVSMASMANKKREARLRRFEHVKRRCVNAAMRRCKRMVVGDTRRGKSRRKKN